MVLQDCQLCTDYWNSKANDVYLYGYLYHDQHIPEAHTNVGFQQGPAHPYPSPPLPASGPSVYGDPQTQFNSAVHRNLYPPPISAPASGPCVYEFNSVAAHPNPSGPDDLQLQTQLNIANAKISELEAELDDALARGNSLHIQLNARTNIARTQNSTFQLGDDCQNEIKMDED